MDEPKKGYTTVGLKNSDGSTRETVYRADELEKKKKDKILDIAYEKPR